MDHAVIPAPARFEAGGGPGFAFRPGTMVAYADTAVAPLVGRFCAQVTRRTGLRLTPVPGDRVPDEPSVTIALTAANEPGGLPASAGLSPGGGDPADERYSLVIEDGQVLLLAAEPVGVARGLTTLIQLMATSPSASANEIRVPAAQIPDAPRYAWRGLSLDVARTFFTVEEIRRVIDLLELYKLNVLHLHLTDDQAWPLALGHPAASPESGAAFYRDEDLTRPRRLRRGPLRHDRARDRHARAHLRAAGAAAGPEVRPERGRVRVPARPPPPRRVARPGAARDLRADGAGPGRGGRDLPGPLPAHRRGRAPRDAG